MPMEGLQLRTTVTDAQMVEATLVMKNVPEPAADEVIVRVEAAPINPSDLGLMFAGADLTRAAASGTTDRPVVTAPLPAAAARAAAARTGRSLRAGNEGAGTVIAAGDSDAARALLGKVVAMAGGGMYAQYRAIGAAACLELPAGMSAADGASSWVCVTNAERSLM